MKVNYAKLDGNIPVTQEPRSRKKRRVPKEKEGKQRLRINPTTCDKDYSDGEISFMNAMDQYKRANRRPFPTWSEVLEVLESLGYRKVEAVTALPGLSPHAKVRKC
jgi:hypothetical protein